MLSNFYLAWTVYTIIWIVVWAIVIRYRNKEIDLMENEIEKLSNKYESLKEKHDKLQGKYEERCLMSDETKPDKELQDCNHTPNQE